MENNNMSDKELLLNIVNKSGYKVDEKNAQIIDLKNNEVGQISRDGDLITYSFSDGRKIEFNKSSNEVNIFLSNNYYIKFKVVNDIATSDVFISLIMKLSNNHECYLEFNNHQFPLNVVDYKVSLYHDNFKHKYESIEMLRYASFPNEIRYSYCNGICTYISGLCVDDSVLERISCLVYGSFLYSLIMQSGLIDLDEGKEIMEKVNYGMNIINDSVNELINRFITYNLSEKREMNSEKLLYIIF